MYDTKGRFAVHRITAEEAKVRGFSWVWLGWCFLFGISLRAESMPPLRR